MLTLKDIMQAGRSDATQHPISFASDELPTVPRIDWTVVNLITPNLETGPWIAGGAPLRWFQGLPMEKGDIDVWCASDEQYAWLTKKIKDYGANERIDTKNAVTYSWSFLNIDEPTATKEFKIQLCKQQFDSAEQLISCFDFSVCQIATDGDRFVVGEMTVPDIASKTLRIVSKRPDLLKRIVKYSAYGYTLPAAEFNEYLESDGVVWNAESDDYDSVVLTDPAKQVAEEF